MDKIALGDVYITRFGEKISWKSMSPAKQECIKKAVALYNKNPGHTAFINWMTKQPEIIKLHDISLYKIGLNSAGKKSKMYEICTDLLFRIARAEGIIGRVQNVHLQ